MGSEGVADNQQGWSNALCIENVICHCCHGVNVFFINGSLLLEVCVCLCVVCVCVCVRVCVSVCVYMSLCTCLFTGLPNFIIISCKLIPYSIRTFTLLLSSIQLLI